MDGGAGNFILLRSEAEHEGRRMTFLDIFVILSLRDRFRNLELDLTKLTRVLCTGIQESGIRRNECMSGSGNCDDSLGACLRELSSHVTFADFIAALRDIGCFQFADVLLLERLGTPTLCISTNVAPNSRTLSLFYNSVKGHLAEFPDKIAGLDNNIKFIKNDISSLVDQDARQCAVDKLAILTCIKVNMYNTSEEKERAISTLVQDVPTGLDTHSSHIVYCIAMCMISKANCDFDNSKYHLDEARSLNSVYGNAFFKFLIWHTQSLLYRAMHSRDGTSENLQESMTACQLGMSCAVPEPEVVREPWTTTFMMFTAMLLLRIGQMSEILPGNTPNEKSAKEADELLAAANRQSACWTPRREMMYRQCMARIHEDTYRNGAIDDCTHALKAAKSGAYSLTEKRNIRNYLDMLKC